MESLIEKRVGVGVRRVKRAFGCSSERSDKGAGVRAARKAIRLRVLDGCGVDQRVSGAGAGRGCERSETVARASRVQRREKRNGCG